MFFTRLPSIEELDGSGLSPEDYAEEAEIWPENWAVFDIFVTMATQWRQGFSGPTGLDYTVLFNLLDRRFKSPTEWDDALADIRSMESAALTAMRAK